MTGGCSKRPADISYVAGHNFPNLTSTLTIQQFNPLRLASSEASNLAIRQLNIKSFLSLTIIFKKYHHGLRSMLKKILLLAFALLFFTSTLTPKTILATHEQKYKIINGVFGKQCVIDSSGPYTYDQCQNLINPGTYSLVDDFGFAGVQNCIPDSNGPYSYSECQNALHGGSYKIIDLGYGNQCIPDSNGPYSFNECQHEILGGSYSLIESGAAGVYACIADPNGPYTYDECQEQLASTIPDLDSPENGDGEGTGGKPGTNPCPGGNCQTAIGNFSTNPQDFVEQVLKIAIGLAGGIAFILMVIGAIRVLTSTGNPQNVNAGRDMIVAALAGLLFLIFSVLILKFIGVEIIGLSG